MTRRIIPLFTLMLLAPLLAAPVPKGVKKDALPTAAGTTWVYIHDGNEKRTTTEEITESAEKDGATTYTVTIKRAGGKGGPDFEKYRIKDGELALLATTAGTFDPPWTLWKPGLKDGDSWEDKYKLGGVTFELTTTVGKPEEVTVPAGKFTATPVTQRYAAAGGPGWEVVVWYADGVGMVKQSSNGRVEQELKSFTAGKGEKK